MVTEFVTFFTAGLKVFSEERRRHFSKEWSELLTEKNRLENLVHPHYSQLKIALHKEKMEVFEKAYAREFSEAMENVKISFN